MVEAANKSSSRFSVEAFETFHLSGIFFQNKVDYATWFGWRYDFIHGIQMLPVTPALLMIRTPEFCRQEPNSWNIHKIFHKL